MTSHPHLAVDLELKVCSLLRTPLIAKPVVQEYLGNDCKLHVKSVDFPVANK